MGDSEDWLLGYDSRARIRLFCFPYAGGGPSIFHDWPAYLPEDIAVCPLQYPGHESRRCEPLFPTLSSLIAALGHILMPLLHAPYALFGHSLGALVAFEFARHLRAWNAPPPAQLFISAHRAPHIPYPHPFIHTLPDLEFIRALSDRYRGLPGEILENYEKMQVFLPSLRADFTMVETYTYRPEPPLTCPISAFGGTEDTWAPAEHIKPWQEHTTASFNQCMLEGDHFFLHDCKPWLLSAIAEALAGSCLPHGQLFFP